MDLDPQSRMVVDGLNRSGALPFSKFSAVAARNELLKLRVSRPAVPAYETLDVSEETISTPDGSFRVRILRPRAASIGQPRSAVIYFHGGGFFAGGLDKADLIVQQIAQQADVVVFNVVSAHDGAGWIAVKGLIAELTAFDSGRVSAELNPSAIRKWAEGRDAEGAKGCKGPSLIGRWEQRG